MTAYFQLVSYKLSLIVGALALPCPQGRTHLPEWGLPCCLFPVARSLFPIN